MKEKFEKAKEEMPVIGILRDIPEGSEVECIQTALHEGLTLLEVTMNTPNAEVILQKLKEASEGKILIGAGTVRSLDDLEKAARAGAEFIVSPTVFKEIIRRGKELSLPMIPGALTPTEIETAAREGAFCVKVFPVSALGGPKYIRELRGPFRDLPLLACGGVSADNATEYLLMGSDMLAFGGSIFNPKLMREKNWNLIGEKLRALLDSVRKARG